MRPSLYITVIRLSWSSRLDHHCGARHFFRFLFVSILLSTTVWFFVVWWLFMILPFVSLSSPSFLPDISWVSSSLIVVLAGVTPSLRRLHRHHHHQNISKIDLHHHDQTGTSVSYLQRWKIWKHVGSPKTTGSTSKSQLQRQFWIIPISSNFTILIPFLIPFIIISQKVHSDVSFLVSFPPVPALLNGARSSLGFRLRRHRFLFSHGDIPLAIQYE